MDWMSDAADEAAIHLATRLRTRFGSKSWAEFSVRLSEHGDRLFQRLHRLYGWRYDFAWIYEQMIEVAAEGYLNRPKALRRIDRKTTVPPAWLSDPGSLWAMAYLDRYAGTVKGLREHFDHLATLGITHLHVLPPYAVPDGPSDGGFAISDYRQLRDGLGTTEKLEKIASELREIGVTLVLDLVANHTASDHPWAKAASAGDSRYKKFYFAFSDRTVPDQYAPHLPSMGSDRGGDAFTWHPDMDGGSWVWTTFHSFQWDLNYSNPEVLAAMAGEMLFLINLGAGVIRMDSLPFLWKRAGTTCENLPEAHVIVQILRILVEIAAPSVTFQSGSVARTNDVDPFVGPEECRVGHNPLLMSSVWEALATSDTRLLSRALDDRFPEGCTSLTYLRSHDDIGWWFADEDAAALGIDPQAHRHYLNEYYQGRWQGSVARGQVSREHPGTDDLTLSGTVASLAGLEVAVEDLDPTAAELAVRRILAAFAVVIGAGGVPMIFLGDEIAQLSDHTYMADSDLAHDSRWSHRPFLDRLRLQSAQAGEGVEGAVLAGLRRLLDVRRSLDGFEPGIRAEPVDLGDVALIGFRRGPVLVVVNMTDRPVITSRPTFSKGDLFDLISGESWDGHVLGPFEYRYLTDTQDTGANSPVSSLRA
jgi:amylosucrase